MVWRIAPHYSALLYGQLRCGRVRGLPGQSAVVPGSLSLERRLGFDRVKSGSATLAASTTTAAMGQRRPRLFVLGWTACCAGLAVVETRRVGKVACGISPRWGRPPDGTAARR